MGLGKEEGVRYSSHPINNLYFEHMKCFRGGGGSRIVRTIWLFDMFDIIITL